MRARTRPAPSRKLDMDEIFDNRDSAGEAGDAMLVRVARAWVISASVLAAVGAVIVVIS